MEEYIDLGCRRADGVQIVHCVKIVTVAYSFHKPVLEGKVRGNCLKRAQYRRFLFLRGGNFEIRFVLGRKM